MKGKRKNGVVVAIDGPAGAGKSTVAKLLASRMNYDYVDTGAIYRCVALIARERGILTKSFLQGSAEDGAIKQGEKDQGLKAIIDELISQDAIRFSWESGVHCVRVSGRDVSKSIREENNSQAASSISARPLVRAGLLDFQRHLARHGGAVLEGRDTGTVVFPDAELKVFLSATPPVRAQRRFQEQKDKGLSPVLEDVLASINERDRQDQQRAAAPLRKADDAVELDTTGLSIEQVVDRLVALANQRALGTAGVDKDS